MAAYGLIAAVIFLLTVVDCRHGRHELSFEDQLVKDILKKYEVRGLYSRPVRKYNDTLKLTFGLQLIQIIDLNEQDQILTLNVWVEYVWYDEGVSWNITKFGGVNKVRLPWSKIWTPDIKLYNYADYRLDEQRKSLCVFHNDGRILWIPQAIYRSSCPIDVTKFPFDVQKCKLKFGSWTYDGYKLDVDFKKKTDIKQKMDYIDLSAYVESNAWKIIDVPAHRTVEHYTCCPEPYVDLTFSLIFQRRATLYNYTLILPCFLLTSITLILFWIPPESPAKMQLGLTIFIAFFILLKILEKNLPSGIATMPLLGTYYCLNMIIITLSSFLNVLVVNLAAYGQRASLPSPAKSVLFDVCAKVLLMNDLVRPFKSGKSDKVCEVSAGDKSADGDKWSQDPSASTEVLVRLRKEQVPVPGFLNAIDGKLSELRDFIRMHKTRMLEKDRRDLLVKEWKAIALILDRIFFVIYFIIITASLLAVIPGMTSAPEHQSTRLAQARGLSE